MTDKERYLELTGEMVKKVFECDPSRVCMYFNSYSLRITFFDNSKDEEWHYIIALSASARLDYGDKLKFTINTVNDVVLSCDESKTTEEAWREMVNEQLAKAMISEKE